LGDVQGAMFCNRALTQNQISRLYSDPWALYRPEPRRVFYSTSAFMRAYLLSRQSAGAI
jgi:hypothetical protein